MKLSASADWIFGGVAVVCALWTLVKSVHVKVKVRVRKLTSEEAESAPDEEPKFALEKEVRVEHGKPIHFGTRNG